MSIMVDLGACFRNIGYQVLYCVQYKASNGGVRGSDVVVSVIVRLCSGTDVGSEELRKGNEEWVWRKRVA